MDRQQEWESVPTYDFAVSLRPEAVENAEDCCLQVDGVWDCFGRGSAVSGDVNHMVAGEEAQSEKGCGKTLDQRVAYWSGSTTLYLI